MPFKGTVADDSRTTMQACRQPRFENQGSAGQRCRPHLDRSEARNLRMHAANRN